MQQAEGVDAREGEAEQAAAWSEPEAPGEGAGPRPDIEQAEQEPAPPGTTQQAYAPPPGHGWTPGYGYGVPQGHGIPQGYGAPMGMSPWYSPYQMYPYPSPFGGFFWWPFPAPYFPAPPFMMMPYGGPFPAQAPYPYPPQQYSYPGGPAPYAGGARRGRMRPLYIVLIILGTLIVIGGGVAAAVLLSGGSSNASFRLGDGSVVGSNVEFSNMVLKQNGSTITLSGTYDNAGKYEGDVIVTVQAMTSTGQSQLISFTVPVVPGTGKSFSQRQASGSLKLSGATLSSIEASSSTSGSGTGTYPFNSSGGQTSSPSGTSTLPLYQSTLPFDSSGSYPYQY